VIVRLGDSHCVGLSDSHDFVIRLVERLMNSCLHRSPGSSTTTEANKNRKANYENDTCYDVAEDRIGMVRVAVTVAVATNNNWGHIGGVVGVGIRWWVINWLCVSVCCCICISVGLGRSVSGVRITGGLRRTV